MYRGFSPYGSFLLRGRTSLRPRLCPVGTPEMFSDIRLRNDPGRARLQSCRKSAVLNRGFKIRGQTGHSPQIGTGGRVISPPLPHHRTGGPRIRRFDKLGNREQTGRSPRKSESPDCYSELPDTEHGLPNIFIVQLRCVIWRFVPLRDAHKTKGTAEAVPLFQMFSP